MGKSRGGGGGWRRVRRRRSSHLASVDLVDSPLDVGNSELNSSSSDDDAQIYQRRDRCLDDALFGFFSKQAIKSLKRNFSKFCNESSDWEKCKIKKMGGVDRSSFTRFSIKYFVEVLRNLTPHQRSVIEKFGFGCLLLFECCELPSRFTRWVADRVDPLSSQITINGRPVSISKFSFHQILGLPIGGEEVPSNNNDGRDFILSHFQLSAMPHITFFGNKLRGSEVLSEHDVFVCFMLVSMDCFLCPSSNECPNNKYLAVLRDPMAASKYDFSNLVYEHCLVGITEFTTSGKLKGRRPRTPFCCNYALLVYYLDCLDFGRQNVSLSLPRVAVWRGSMIKVFSELDRKNHHYYGKRLLKQGLSSCWPQGMFPADPIGITVYGGADCIFSGVRKAAHASFDGVLHAEVIDGIVSIVQSFVSDKLSTTQHGMDVLVNDLLAFLCKSKHYHIPDASKCLDACTIKNQNKSNATHKKGFSPSKRSVSVPKVRSEGPCNNSPSLETEVLRDFHVGGNYSHDPETPECMITKVVESYSQRTAPTLKPLKKVKARNCRRISKDDELELLNRFSKDTCEDLHPVLCIDKDGTGVIRGHEGCEQAFKFSPIGQINIPLSPVSKPSTANFKINHVHAPKLSGSREAPIVIAEATRKTALDENCMGVRMAGSNDFRRRCNDLSKKADLTYNKMMLSKPEAAKGVSAPETNLIHVDSEEQEKVCQIANPHKARRKFRFVNWLMTAQDPPLLANTRFPVSVEDIINYSAMVELAHDPSSRTEMGVLYPKVHCNYQSLGESLMPRGEVDNFIIPCFCRLFFDERHPVSSGRHYFFSHIGEAILKYRGDHEEGIVRTSFEGATKASRGKKLEKSDRINNFTHLWELIVSHDHNFDIFKIMYPNVPKQDNVKDCGVYSLKLMEKWVPWMDMRTVFGQQDIINIRIQYAIKLYFASQNGSDLSLVTEFYAKG